MRQACSWPSTARQGLAAPEPDGGTGIGEVVMQAAQLRHHIGCRAAVRRRRQQEGLDAISQRQGAAVRHDDTQLRVALQVPGEDQSGDCARAVSKMNSTMGGGRPRAVCCQQGLGRRRNR